MTPSLHSSSTNFGEVPGRFDDHLGPSAAAPTTPLGSAAIPV